MYSIIPLRPYRSLYGYAFRAEVRAWRPALMAGILNSETRATIVSGAAGNTLYLGSVAPGVANLYWYPVRPDP